MGLSDYSKTAWVNGTTPAINADNLNKIEQELLDLDMFSCDDKQYVGKEIFKKQQAWFTLSVANHYFLFIGKQTAWCFLLYLHLKSAIQIHQ